MELPVFFTLDTLIVILAATAAVQAVMIARNLTSRLRAGQYPPCHGCPSFRASARGTGNAQRRDLTAAQRAIVAARALPAFEEEAKKRMAQGGKKKGKVGPT